MDERDETRRIAEAVGDLEQAMGGIALVLKDHGQMLAQLLLLATEKPVEETELEKLIRQLVVRIDRQQGALERIEKEIQAFNAVAEKAGTGS